jgi:hypothetical protein
MRYILVVGNVLRGLRFIGPFGTRELASAHAEEAGIKDEWIVAELFPSKPH